MADYLADEVDDRIDRAVKRGAKDTGDIAGVRVNGHKVAIEVKNVARVELAKWATEVEVERLNLQATAGVIIHKRKGTQDPRKQWVTMTAENFVALLKAVERTANAADA